MHRALQEMRERERKEQLKERKTQIHNIYTYRCSTYAFPCLPYLAYITLDLNPASWAASAAQLAEHWTSNPVVTGSNPV